jgi:hypothetical protein
MKNQFKIIRLIMLSLGLSLLMLFKANAQVGIGTSSPEASAKLDITSASKGFLLPRVTLSQRNSITPTTGLQVYCTDCGSGPGELQIYNGTTWTNAAGTAASGIVFSPPANVVATAGTAQASVSFTAPTATGGFPITSFTVTSTPGNISVSGSSSPLQVTGLTTGTAYTFKVIATNSNSVSSVASSSSNSIIVQ